MSFEAEGRFVTVGRRLFLAAVKDLETSEVLRRLATSRQTYWHLRNGTKRPSLDLAARIEREFNIPARTWARATA